MIEFGNNLLKFTDSRKLASLIPIFQPFEDTNKISSSSGIPLGRTKYYSSLLRLNLNNPPNPHVAIVGMTGSGKTHLIKTIVACTSIIGSESQSIIDWSGEYTDLSEELGGLVVRSKFSELTHSGCYPSGKITCFDLSKLEGKDAEVAANKILESIILDFKRQGFCDKVRSLIFIDEAWKLTGANGMLGPVFREARKYGLSIVAASQMFGDITNEIVANSSSLFIFRLQNPEDLESISAMHLFEKIENSKIKELGRGECASITFPSPGVKCETIIQVMDTTKSKFYRVRSLGGDAVFSEREIKVIAHRLGIGEQIISTAILSSEEGKYIDISKMSKSLLASGIQLATIVALMRLIGVNDTDIALLYGTYKSKRS
ncbi:MAG: DUF87 domain-containing protein [Candidatus Micrarchaeaceae archaeon]